MTKKQLDNLLGDLQDLTAEVTTAWDRAELLDNTNIGDIITEIWERLDSAEYLIKIIKKQIEEVQNND